ncbi:MAG: CHRD domain-containing protein [Myxococcales bacterium]
MRQGMMLLCCAALVACGSSSNTEAFHANMTSAQEVPAPTGLATPPPTGTAVFTNNGDGTVSYTVNATGLSTQFSGVTFTGMHIHFAPVGTAAGIVVPLTTPTPGTTAGTTSVTGTFTSSTCASGGTNCINTGNTIDTVLTNMRNGGAYLNIHTSRNPTGELRGQVATGGQ